MIKHLPNVLTFFNLTFGFLSLTYTVDGKYNIAALMIILSVVMDSLDGRAARRFDAVGDLGKNLDSLSDVVSFGVAPALLVFEYQLILIPYIGKIVCILYCVAGAFRLARFNVTPSSDHFQGVPITFAGGIIALSSFISASISPLFWAGLLLLLAVLMVSNLKVPKINTKK